MPTLLQLRAGQRLDAADGGSREPRALFEWPRQTWPIPLLLERGNLEPGLGMP
jgi:hypothetical protein